MLNELFFQNKLASGATVLGAILSSDKTNISAMTGGRNAHPLLISLANISMEFRNKATSNSYLLLALLPIPQFIHSKKKVCSMLDARLYHRCLDIILEPLKSAARFGVIFSDPLGNLRWCFTPLASFIVDTPEAQLISCVGGKSSPVTLAKYDQFGDDFRHDARTGATTLNSINLVNATPEAAESLEKYEKIAKEYRLNGVQFPFWRDWPLSDPSIFLTSEPLHHWHRQFWDHDAKWCIHAAGDKEIDFRFSVLRPHTGYRHFKEGISKLKQVTGREQRDIQRYIVAVVADAVPPQFSLAIRSLMDFRYLAQSTIIDDKVCQRISEALLLFHTNKDIIIDVGARRGKKGKQILHWHIPKLELLQSVVPNIKSNGMAIQWSADYTEHAHIPLVKVPARASNNQGYESQICRYLDRLEKIRNFNLATAIRGSGIQFVAENVDREELEEADDDPEDCIVSTTSELLSLLSLSGYKSGLSQPTVDYFYRAKLVRNGSLPSEPATFPRTFQSPDNNNVVYHFSRDPTYSNLSINSVAELYRIPDFLGAISDFVTRISSSGVGFVSVVGGRRSGQDHGPSISNLRLRLWTSLRLQTTGYHFPNKIILPATIHAAPPSSAWKEGQYDPAIICVDPSRQWPKSGFTGLFTFFFVRISLKNFQQDIW